MAKQDLVPDEMPDERELLAIIDEEITSGTSFQNDTEHDNREIALEYYKGIMRDVPADPDWSHAISRDVSNTIDALLPGLLRVFAGSGQIVTYAPTAREDEGRDAQATDYVNYLWENELNGYLVLFTAIHDALTVRNGVVKVFWDPTPDYETQDLTGLSEDQLTFLMQDQELQVIGANVRQQQLTDPMSGQSMAIPVYDIRIRRATNNGRLRLECVPPEYFGISARAKTPDEARIVWHYDRKTRSDLVKDGFTRELVDEMPAWTQYPENEVDRDEDLLKQNAPSANWAMQEIDVYECYMLYDSDGDGVAERRKIVVCGPNGGRKILSNDPWPNDLPFVDLKPQPVPHRWQGRSIADETMDLQRVKTVLLRQMLDNLYLVNRPQREVVETNINNPDEVINPKIGGIIRVKAAGSIQSLETPYIGDKAMAGMQYIDGIIKQRTGSSAATMALDATALDPQTATAEQIEHDASYARVELIARNMAELGLKPLFQKILRILVRNQDRPRTIRLRNKWVDMDPRSWNANMDATVNVGLGTGSRERDLAMLGGVAKQQDQVVQQLGPNNPIVTPSMWVGTRHKMVEAAGLRNADQYFSDISDQEFQQWQASQPPPSDPKANAEKAKLQIQSASAQQKGQIESAKGQRQLALQGAKASADIQLKREKQAADIALKKRKDEMDFAEGLRELQLEAYLKQLEIEQGDKVPDESNIRETTND